MECWIGHSGSHVGWRGVNHRSAIGDISMVVLWADIASQWFGIRSGSCGFCQVVPERVVKTASTATSLPLARHPDLLTFCDSCCAHFSAHFSALQPGEPGLDHDHPNRGYEGQETGSVHDVSFIFFRILESFPVSVSQLWHPFPCSQEENMHIYYSGSYYMIDCMLESWNPEELFGFAAAAYRCVLCDDPDIWPRWFLGAVQHRWHCQCCCSSRWDLRIIENLWVVDTWWQHGDNVTDVIGYAWKWRNSDRFLVTLILHCHHQVIIHQRRLRRELGEILHPSHWTSFKQPMDWNWSQTDLKLWTPGLPRSWSSASGSTLDMSETFKVLEWHLQCFCVRGTSHAIC